MFNSLHFYPYPTYFINDEKIEKKKQSGKVAYKKKKRTQRKMSTTSSTSPTNSTSPTETIAEVASTEEDEEKIYSLVNDLTNPENREAALLELSKKREKVPDLAPIIWNSVGTISSLLQELVSIYPLLCPPKLKANSSNRVCNALALLQCVASHKETRSLFIKGTFFLKSSL
jgi:hypothetical protein